MRQRLDPPSTDPPRSLTSAVSLARGDRLIDVQAALDDSGAYFFWNITRANGVSETWVTWGLLTTEFWQPPARLKVNGESLRWAAPLPDQPGSLRAAVASDSGLGIVTLNGGQAVDYQTLVPDAHLIGQPLLRAAANGDLVLAWAQPGDSAANLQVMVKHP